MKASLARIAAAAIAMCVPLACAARELDADAFARAAKGLASNAREARTFVEALRDDQLTYAYAFVHREALAKQVRDTAKPLDDPAPAVLAPKASRAKQLAEKLRDVLERMNGHIGEPDAAAGAARELDPIASDLAKLADAS
jgi:hypothetical protein